ncbi:DUF397 domain-containing protein [Streptomyces sp. 4N509B]|uniref:DUF397 domain-containing protein n=1 Tax=Streptomyces sp. 4N509B TaxID=3457413 RepID=UPI003FD05C12
MSANPWQKSSFSSNDGNKDCLELASTGGGPLLLRESDEPEVVIASHPMRVAALLGAIKGGLRP